MAPAPRTPTLVATLTGSTGSTTLALVVVLVAVGLAMIVTAIWLVRATRTDAPALGPLEVMGTRSWARSGADQQAATLARARPADAPPPAPLVPFGDEAEVADPPEVPVVAAHTALADDDAHDAVEADAVVPIDDDAPEPEPEPGPDAVDEPAEVDERAEPDPQNDAVAGNGSGAMVSAPDPT